MKNILLDPRCLDNADLKLVLAVVVLCKVLLLIVFGQVKTYILRWVLVPRWRTNNIAAHSFILLHWIRCRMHTVLEEVNSRSHPAALIASLILPLRTFPLAFPRHICYNIIEVLRFCRLFLTTRRTLPLFELLV